MSLLSHSEHHVHHVRFNKECYLIPSDSQGARGRPRISTRSFSVSLPLNWVSPSGGHPVIQLDHQDPSLPSARPKNPSLTVKIPSLTRRPHQHSPSTDVKSCLRSPSRERSSSFTTSLPPSSPPQYPASPLSSPTVQSSSSFPSTYFSPIRRRNSASATLTVPLRQCCPSCAAALDRLSCNPNAPIPWSPGARRKKLEDEKEANAILAAKSAGVIATTRVVKPVGDSLLKVDEVSVLEEKGVTSHQLTADVDVESSESTEQFSPSSGSTSLEENVIDEVDDEEDGDVTSESSFPFSPSPVSITRSRSRPSPLPSTHYERETFVLSSTASPSASSSTLWPRTLLRSSSPSSNPSKNVSKDAKKLNVNSSSQTASPSSFQSLFLSFSPMGNVIS